MQTDNISEPREGSQNPLKGLGQRLKLHIILPIVYAVILITLLIAAHASKEMRRQ